MRLTSTGSQTKQLGIHGSIENDAVNSHATKSDVIVIDFTENIKYKTESNYVF